MTVTNTLFIIIIFSMNYSSINLISYEIQHKLYHLINMSCIKLHNK